MTSDEAYKEALACMSEGFGAFSSEHIAQAFWNAALEWAKSGQEPVAFVNGDELDNMLDDKSAVIESQKSNYRKTPLYKNPLLKPTSEPLFWYRPVCNGEMYEGPHHKNSTIGKCLREDKPSEWLPLYTHPAPAHPVRLTEAEIEAFKTLAWGGAHIAPQSAKQFAEFIMDAMLAKGAAQPAVAQKLVEACKCVIGWSKSPNRYIPDTCIEQVEAALKAAKGAGL